MKALSIWQPWADLISMGYKTIETRTWPTRYRGALLICAARKTGWEVQEAIEQYQQYPGLYGYDELLPSEYEPRLGVAVATCTLADCRPMIDSDRKAALYQLEGGSVWGRYAWVLEDVEPISPFPIRGKQGLFDVEIPIKTPHFDHIYRVRKYMGGRYGQRCRVLAQGTGPGPHNMLLEFEDGFRFVSPKFSAIPESDWKPKAQLELF